jgi:hypothetical protein
MTEAARALANASRTVRKSPSGEFADTTESDSLRTRQVESANARSAAAWPNIPVGPTAHADDQPSCRKPPGPRELPDGFHRETLLNAAARRPRLKNGGLPVGYRRTDFLSYRCMFSRTPTAREIAPATAAKPATGIARQETVRPSVSEAPAPQIAAAAAARPIATTAASVTTSAPEAAASSTATTVPSVRSDAKPVAATSSATRGVPATSTAAKAARRVPSPARMAGSSPPARETVRPGVVDARSPPWGILEVGTN